MSVIPQDIKDAASQGGSNKFIKAEEFEGKGLTLVVKGFEKIKSNNAKFGANEKDALFDQGILAEGETFRYSFKGEATEADPFGADRQVESKSLALFIAFNEADPSEGDTVHISKSGKMEETRYNVVVIKKA